MNDTKIVRLLSIATGSADVAVTTKKIELPASNPAVVKETILSELNRMGKSSSVIGAFKGKLYHFSHTAARGPSDSYFKSEIRYHPMAEQIA